MTGIDRKKVESDCEILKEMIKLNRSKTLQSKRDSKVLLSGNRK